MQVRHCALAAAGGGLRADETHIYVVILGIFCTQYTFESKYATIAHQKASSNEALRIAEDENKRLVADLLEARMACDRQVEHSRHVNESIARTRALHSRLGTFVRSLLAQV